MKFFLGFMAAFLVAGDVLADPGFNTDREPFLQAQALGKIEELTIEEMNRWGVPGLSIAIVKDGKLIYTKGFGFRDPGLSLRVTPQTDFALASITKSFTALTMGLMVDDGLIGWDTPVSKRVPEFVLSDPAYTSQVSLRDMLSHRTGLEAGDSLWASGEYSVEELFDRLDELEVKHPLRHSYEYNNVLYIASAHLVGKLTDNDWTDVARDRILSPIGMRSSGFSIEEYLVSKEYSVGFGAESGAIHANELPAEGDGMWYSPRGSGSMFSNAKEMANWLLFQMGDGTFEGARVVSENVLNLTHTGQIPLGTPPFYLAYPGITDHAYALGWFVDNYKGFKRLHHGGASPMGFSSYIALYPQKQLGIVILSNRFVLMPVQLVYQISDLLLGLEVEDWQVRFADYVP